VQKVEKKIVLSYSVISKQGNICCSYMSLNCIFHKDYTINIMKNLWMVMVMTYSNIPNLKKTEKTKNALVRIAGPQPRLKPDTF
jgi:hypothetical protein